MDQPWRRKAESIAASEAYRAWEKANRLPNGRIRKRHKQYAVPTITDALCRALGLPEPACEMECKRLFQAYLAGAETLY